jgi:hypothetical protein
VHGAPLPDTAPVVQLAILLDTSNSMDGLIDQARSRLWSIVNTMALSKKGGQMPDLRVALFEYGNDGLAAAEGHIRLVVPLSDDLDKLSAELFALRTNGGSEHCGQVIQAAADRLQWSEGDIYKAIFIAGNEPFTQGPQSYEAACRAAIAKGIVVNTIHCGPADLGTDGKWTHAAQLADGQALNIDQGAETFSIATPQDARIEELSRKLNTTYLGYGAHGRARKEEQEKQDSNAEASAPGAAAQRGQAKASGAYRNSGWDVVDGVADKAIDLETAKDEDLPEEMRGLTVEQRKAFVAKKAAERETIKAEIGKLSSERDRFIALERKKMSGKEADTFESAVQSVLAEQLSKKGYEVEVKK